MRSTTAPPTPQKITLARIARMRPATAAMPTTMALSPASTKSIMMICDEGDELLIEVHGKRLLVSGLDGLTGFAANPPEATAWAQDRS